LCTVHTNNLTYRKPQKYCKIEYTGRGKQIIIISGSSHVGFVVDKVELGQVFSKYFGFRLPIFISLISPQSPSPIIRGWYKRPVVAAVPKVTPHTLKKILFKKNNKRFLWFE
jgi:hypothetical protein